MKALVGTFNQEKALIGAFSVIAETCCGTDGLFYSTGQDQEAAQHPLHPLLLQLGLPRPEGGGGGAAGGRRGPRVSGPTLHTAVSEILQYLNAESEYYSAFIILCYASLA